MVGIRGKVKGGDVGWVQLKLEDIVLQQKGAFVSGPFGSNISAKFFVDAGVPVIRGNNLTKGEQKFLDEGFVFLTDSKAAEFSNCIAKEGDIIFTAAGSIGQVGIIPGRKRYPYYIISNKQLRARIDPTKAKPLFAYYWLSSKKMVRWLESMNNGGAVPLLNLGIVRKAPIPCPPIKIQQRICDILSAYDDLIENNRRRIQLLEQSARLLYKEWFVHLRFPGHERIAVTNGVPEGWERKLLGDVLDVAKGRNITKDSVDEGNVPVVAGGLFPAYYHSTANALGPVVTVSASGANAGYVNLYHEDIWASDCSYISRTSTEYLYYFYLLLVSKQKEIFGFQKGAAQPHVYPKDLKRLPLLCPANTIVKLFEESVSYNFLLVERLLSQNKLLAKARDILLPRLMSGKVEL
ncbi:MAG: restriction endonuclease subunit S [Gammaproteobacteria bacterium]|nr:restriction endonuclease subunit S [Gammaproteobacteria bacterium]